MGRSGFYVENRNRAFPFLKGSAGVRGAAPDAVEGLPNDAVVDAGFVAGLSSGWNDAEGHTVYLARVRRSGGDVLFEFASDAPGLYGRTLTFTRSTTTWREYETEHVEDVEDGDLSAASAGGCFSCIQLGTAGAFVAPCTGRLRLFFNDDYWGDNSGSYVITINGTPYTVPAVAIDGVDGPLVTAGVTYNYTTTGTIQFGVDGEEDPRLADADGTTSETSREAPTKCPCPGLVKWSLVGRVEGTSPDEPPASCAGEPLWSGYLVTGRLDALLALIPGDGDEITPATDVGGVVEPALVQDAAGAYVSSLNVANADRTRVDAASGCPTVVWPFETGPGVTYIDATCLRGDVRFRAGFNAVVRQEDDTNTMTFGAEVGAGDGQPCDDQVKLFAGETPPTDGGNGSELLEGGPRCNDIVRSMNGVGGRFAVLLAGTGVDITPLPDEHKLVVNVNMRQLAVCYSSFSAVSETE